MSDPTANTEVIRKFLMNFHKPGLDKLMDECLAPDVEGMMDGNPVDKATHMQYIQAYLGFFGDWKTVIHTLSAKGNKVICKYTMNVTHKAEFAGIPATHKRIPLNATFSGIFNKQGKVQKWEQQIDNETAIAAMKA